MDRNGPDPVTLAQCGLAGVGATVGQPTLRSGRPGDTKGTEEDQGRDGGTTDFDSFVKH